MTEEARSAAWPQQCPDPSKCYGVGCHGCEEPHISKMAPGVKMPAPSSAATCRCCGARWPCPMAGLYPHRKDTRK